VRLTFAPHSHRPVKVLDAPGMSADYYSQPIDYGLDKVCAALGSQVLLFDPDATASMACFVNVPTTADDATTARRGGAFHARPTRGMSVMSAARDGFDDGGSDGVGASPAFDDPSPPPRTGSNTPVIARQYASPPGSEGPGGGVSVSPSLIRPPPERCRSLARGGAAIDVSAVTFARFHSAPTDSCVAVADRRSRVMLLHAVEGSNVLASSPLRRVSDDELLAPAAPSHVVNPHALGVTAMDAFGDVVGVGLGRGGVELFDCRSPRRPIMVLAQQPAWPLHGAFEPAHARAQAAAAHPITSLVFSPDGAAVACGSNDGVVRIWSLSRAAEPVASVVHRHGGVRASWSPTHRGLLATAGGSTDMCLAISDVHRSVKSSPHDGSCIAAVNTMTQLARVDWITGGSHIVTAHGFGAEELASRGGGASAEGFAEFCGVLAPRVDAPARSLCAWAVDMFVGAHGSRPGSRLGVCTAGAGAPVHRPVASSLRGDSSRPPSRSGARVTLPLAPRPPSSAADGAALHPLDCDEWEAVCVSPLDSPRVNSLTVPRGRANRLDLMPLNLGDSGAPGAALHMGMGTSTATNSRILQPQRHLLNNNSAAGSSAGGSGAKPPAAGAESNDAIGCTVSLAGALKSHSSRPLHLARRKRLTGQYLTASGGEGDETLRFWKPFTVSMVPASVTGACTPGSGAPLANVSAGGSRSATPPLASLAAVHRSLPSPAPQWDEELFDAQFGALSLR
jgi:WD40 repeat protein